VGDDVFSPTCCPDPFPYPAEVCPPEGRPGEWAE
jgi:hypothetical protein